MEVLKEVEKIWSDHCLCTRMISDILMYLDRVYSREAGLPLVYDSGLILFRDNLIRNPEFQVGSYLYKNIISEIQKERRGEMIDRLAIKPIISMLESLPSGQRIDSESLYQADFEPLLETASAEFFDNAAEVLTENGIEASSYIHKVRQWLEEETLRTNMYLPQSTLLRIMPVIENTLITQRIEKVINEQNTGLVFWCENEKYDDLGLLYGLVGRIDDQYDCIRSALSAKLLQDGRGLNRMIQMMTEEAKEAKSKGNKERAQALSPTNIAINWISKVLDLKKRYDEILKQSFKNNKGFEMTIDNAFSQFINENKKVSEFLSLYIDDHLKKSFKGKNDEEVEEVLEQTIMVFRFIGDKDLFEMYYKAHLAKRLLSNRSVSEEIEKTFISKIQREVGTALTSKLEGMFRDMRISRDTMAHFRTAKQSGEIQTSMDINVNVLTTTCWPNGVANSSTTCILPPEVDSAKKVYESFYLSRHSGRVLSWNPALGTADVRARFKNRMHEINMPTLAMAILMLFKDLPVEESLTYEQIKERTNIPTNELNRHLLSIAVAPKTKLLRKVPMSKDIKVTDQFYFNEKFESPMTKIKVLAVSSGNKVENDSENKETMDKLQETRKFEIDAAIVRIMKARKSMEHPLLVAAVTQQLSGRFKPDPMVIKRQIESLLDREYLERDKDQRNLYNYLA